MIKAVGTERFASIASFQLEDSIDFRMKDKSGPNRALRAAVVGGGIGGISAACCLRLAPKNSLNY